MGDRYVPDHTVDDAVAGLQHHFDWRLSETALSMFSRNGAYCIEQLVKWYSTGIKRGRPRPSGMSKQRDKECFANAQALAIKHPDLYTYVEGIACCILPCLHGWLEDKDGNVVDPTWRHPHISAYCGVRFSTEYVAGVVAATGYWISMFDNFEQEWPLLRGAVDISTVLPPGERRLRMKHSLFHRSVIETNS